MTKPKLEPKSKLNPKSKPLTPSYQALKTELDAIMNELVREDLDVDEALKHYQRGLALVAQLENYLKTAENKLVELKAKFNIAAQ